MKVLIACEFSGRVRDAFARKGHDAWSCDLLPCERGGQHIQADFRDVIEDTWDFVGYHYECRVMANSGVRWMNPARYQELLSATKIFNLTLDDDRPGYSENSIQHSYARELISRSHDQIIQPWHFGEPYFKATCLWLRDVLPLQDTNRLTPPERGTDEYKLWSDVHNQSPGPNRWKVRSRTFINIAKAMADQWG